MDNQIVEISDSNILRDSEGRYSLNGLHRASGGNPSKRPNEWCRLKNTQELVTEFNCGDSHSLVPIVSIQS